MDHECLCANTYFHRIEKTNENQNIRFYHMNVRHSGLQSIEYLSTSYKNTDLQKHCNLSIREMSFKELSGNR